MSSPEREWTFLGVHSRQLTAPGAPVLVFELILPVGAAPPLHVHDDVDDSLYVLEGTLVMRCGDTYSLATPGVWAQSPRGVPHQFRVVEGPARVLQVHANESFMEFVHAVGHPTADDEATAGEEPGAEELEGVMAEHGIRMLGPSMEAEEAAAWVGRLREAAA